MPVKHLISITDLTSKDILQILKTALVLKKEIKKGKGNKLVLKNKTLVMIFEKPSLRTRVSFEIGMTQLGGHGIYLGPAEIGLGVRESIFDVSRVISSMADVIMARTFKHESVVELAKYSSVPVINGLSDLEHPCQILADLLTIFEIKKKFKGLNLCFIGDGENNVTHSLALASGMLGINFSVASPKGFVMRGEIVSKAQGFAKKNKAKIFETYDPPKAVANADVVYTDTWISMGDEAEKKQRLKIFKNYQITTKLMSLAKKNAIFMHDMPAYRGNEVEAAVIDSPQSVIIQQAENRMHAQKALILYLLNIHY